MNFSILRVRAFRLLWLGQIISQAGDAFYYVSFMFMVREITNSALMVGLVGAAETLPFLLLGPFAGVVADRADRRKVMLASDLGSGMILLLFAVPFLLGTRPQAWGILLTAFALSSVRTFFMPAKSAAIPMLVPEHRVMESNSFSSMTQNSVMLVSIGLVAGVLSLLFKLSPYWFYIWVIGLNALSFLGSAAFIRLLPSIKPTHDKEVIPPHPIADFRAGLAFLKKRRDLAVLICLLGMFRFGSAPFFVVYTESNKQWFDGQPRNLAWFEFAFILGMVVGSLVIGKVPIKYPTRWFAGGLAVVALSVGAMAIYHTIFGFIIANVVAGLALPAADIPLNTYMQLSIPNQFQGRVNAVLNMVATGTMPLANIAMGICILQIGLFWGYMSMGIVMALACAIGLLDRAFRNAQMPNHPATAQAMQSDGLREGTAVS